MTDVARAGVLGRCSMQCSRGAHTDRRHRVLTSSKTSIASGFRSISALRSACSDEACDAVASTPTQKGQLALAFRLGAHPGG